MEVNFFENTGLRLLWQVTERSRSRVPSKNLLTGKRKETGENKHYLLIFKSYVFGQKNVVHI